jgi:hypothetical protein
VYSLYNCRASAPAALASALQRLEENIGHRMAGAAAVVVVAATGIEIGIETETGERQALPRVDGAFVINRCNTRSWPLFERAPCFIFCSDGDSGGGGDKAVRKAGGGGGGLKLGSKKAAGGLAGVMAEEGIRDKDLGDLGGSGGMSSADAAVSAASQAAMLAAADHLTIVISETVSATLSRDGGVESADVKGSLTMTVQSEAASHAQVVVSRGDNAAAFSFQCNVRGAVYAGAMLAQQ